MTALALTILLTAAADPWALPAPGECREAAGLRSALVLTPSSETSQDAPAVVPPPAPGEVIRFADAPKLRGYLPPEIWEHRERLLFDGMSLEIGPCHRDYSPPAFFRQVTQRFVGRAQLDEQGRLSDQPAGLPFPPESLRADDPRAALKWAWNRSFAWSGAGRFGKLRLSIVSPEGVASRWEGDHFYVEFTGRADRAADGFRQPAKTEASWAAGGQSRNLQSGGQCAFRMYGAGRRRPDFFVATSGSRKTRREVAPDAEGPLSACLIDATIGAGLFVHGLVPQLHEWTLTGVVDLLAPINAKHDTYPVDAERGYGPFGISFANDRWELRRVLVLDGRLKPGEPRFEDATQRFRWYLDLQTLKPLYYAAYDARDRPKGIGYFVSRWSEDRPHYPRWPDDPERPVRVLDDVGAAFVEWGDQHGVRIESGDRVSVPPSDDEINRLISQSRMRVR